MSLFTVEISEDLQSVSVHLRRAESKCVSRPDLTLLVIRISEFRRIKVRSFDGGNDEIEAVR